MSYFFHKGKIHVILNKLEILDSTQFDAYGTALMVVNTLMETLGVTKTKLSLILKHFTYDGVYATSEERTHGGGCLNLTKNVASILGLDDDAITGH